MPPLGPITLSLALATTLLLGSVSALGAFSVGESGQSHDSIWRVTDIGLYMDSSFVDLSGAGDAVVAALETWGSADSRLPHVWPVVGSVDELGYRANQSNRNTIRYAAGGEPLAHGALAITMVTYDDDTGTIVDADIVINGIYQFDDNSKYCGQRGDSDAHSAYDLGDVVAHEMGHLFGLPDETADSTAIMYTYFDPGQSRRKCTSDADKQALANLYDNVASDGNKSPACSVSVGPGRYQWPPSILGGIGLIALTQFLRRRPIPVKFTAGIHGGRGAARAGLAAKIAEKVFRDV